MKSRMGLSGKKFNNMALKVGITGGIGAGKTYVSRLFQSLGIPVYNADDRAKELMTDHHALKYEIQKLMGDEAYFPNGQLNRKYIASIVFEDPAKLNKLNGLVHPAVRTDAQNWFSSQKTPYAIQEAALLIESGSFKHLDFLIVVEAPVKLRVQRVRSRDGARVKDIKNRMKNQLTDRERRKFADFRVINNGKRLVIPQVLEIHRQLLVKKMV